jgi:DNA polymerase bacteriophage-type
MKTLHLDLETYSATPITDGTYKYAENAEIMLLAWALDDGEVHLWDLTKGETMPFALHNALADESVLIQAHNSMFDRSVLRLGQPAIPVLRAAGSHIARWRDPMVKALSCSLPGSLDSLCTILGIGEADAKSKDGRALIHKFCKPQPKSGKRNTWRTHPEDWERFRQYAMRDISAMREVDRKLPNWNYQGQELALWHLDQAINDRGILIDTRFAAAAIEAAETAKKGLAEQTLAQTNGEVEKATQRDALLYHIAKNYGVILPDLKSSTIDRRVNDLSLPIELREILAVRMQASMGSASKYKSMLKAVNADNRARGLLQFNGAGRTGRWAGRNVQPQNMFRPPKWVKNHWEFWVEAVRSGGAHLLADNVMELTAALARGGLIAEPGKKFVVADLSNIEGRCQAWLAGEEWKLQAFRDYDTVTGKNDNGEAIRKGPDLYCLAYAKSFRVSPDSVDEDQRQIGKVQELMLGYGGGVGAYLTGSLTYGIDIEALAGSVFQHLPDAILGESAEFLAWTRKQKRGTFGLSDEAFITCDVFKRLWRLEQPKIAALWKAMEEAVREAIYRPGDTIVCGKFKMRRDGDWLRIGLPSGNCLCYPSPRVSEGGQISYMGINQYTRKWERVSTYGGKLFENACQRLARDIMAANMPAIDEAGYGIVLTVHDELVCETPDDESFNTTELSKMLSKNADWNEGLPLAAAGFEALRYRK